ncbi:MAG TPA: chemotaxis-specific protein-glutamate methyltransferase CheB [Gammaproteobacteria bacterium]|nr:chemotaxis-specific protein-glutamate methyltransferase CheB [Gammaproteobacteria bacterium]
MNISIVNDNPSITRLLEQIISIYSTHNVIWTADDGSVAVEKNSTSPPDLILMDLIMPGMNGVEATKKIMKSSPCAILLVTASVEGNAGMVFSAMASGALDAITTPNLSNTNTHSSLDNFLAKLSMIEKLVTATVRPLPGRDLSCSPDITRKPIVCIGSSTGGPGALSIILSGIPEDSEATYVIVQHVDKNFISGLAEWLDAQCKLDVSIAKSGDKPMPGKIYVAGGDKHITVNKYNKFQYTQHPVEYAYRPSIDIFFDSVVNYWHGKVIGVLLTGMGYDGAKGLLNIKNRGGVTIAQNEETCAVFGMPRAAIMANAAQLVLPVQAISAAIEDEVYTAASIKIRTSADG